MVYPNFRRSHAIWPDGEIESPLGAAHHPWLANNDLTHSRNDAANLDGTPKLAGTFLNIYWIYVEIWDTKLVASHIWSKWCSALSASISRSLPDTWGSPRLNLVGWNRLNSPLQMAIVFLCCWLELMMSGTRIQWFKNLWVSLHFICICVPL